MTKQQKIIVSAPRDIPFNKLMLSQSNVRHVKAGVSLEELAEAIARRTLLSSITVRPVLDDSGAETGTYTIPAGGRRFRTLELLVKQPPKRAAIGLVPFNLCYFAWAANGSFCKLRCSIEKLGGRPLWAGGGQGVSKDPRVARQPVPEAKSRLNKTVY